MSDKAFHPGQGTPSVLISLHNFFYVISATLETFGFLVVGLHNTITSFR